MPGTEAYSMQLTPHFSLEEFTFSQTAARFGIDNTLGEPLLSNARMTCAMLEAIRTYLNDHAGVRMAQDRPVRITSGYRCAELNACIGSKPTSHHVLAAAADIVAPWFGTPYQVAQALAPAVDALGIGQLIHEYGQWVHVSCLPVAPQNRIITISRAGTVTGIQQV